MGIFSKKSISTEAAQQPQPKNNAMADTMPQDASQQVPVAVTPPMQAPLQSPVFAAPQPQPQQATAPDAAVAAPQPQQAAAPAGQMQMPTGLTSPIQQYRADQQAMTQWLQGNAAQVQKGIDEQKAQQQAALQAKAPAAMAAQGKLTQAPAASDLAAVPEPQDKPIEEIKPSNYYTKYGNYNWDSNDGDFWKNAKESGLSLRDAINYYNKWQEDNNGKPLDMYEQYALLKKYDPFRSMKEQDEEDERLKRQQKWEKISNLFNHLANLYGTVRGANPAQQIESGTDLTKRQQEAVDRVRALRKAAGQDYIDALAAKRADEFKQRQLENEAKRLAEQQRSNDLMNDYRLAALAERAKNNDTRNNQNQQKIENQDKQAERKAGQRDQEIEIKKQDSKSRAKTASAAVTRANKSGSGGRGGKAGNVVITTSNKNALGNGRVVKETISNDEYAARKKAEAKAQAQAKKNANMSKLNIKGAAKRK